MDEDPPRKPRTRRLCRCWRTECRHAVAQHHCWLADPFVSHEQAPHGTFKLAGGGTCTSSQALVSPGVAAIPLACCLFSYAGSKRIFSEKWCIWVAAWHGAWVIRRVHSCVYIQVIYTSYIYTTVYIH